MQTINGKTYCFDQEETWLLKAALDEQVSRLRERANEVGINGPNHADSERLDRMADEYQALANQITRG